MSESPPAPLASRIPAADVPTLRALLAVVVGVVMVVALYLGREVLIPITLAVLLSFVLAPVVDLLRRLYLGRILSVLLAALLALGVLLFLGGLIGTQLAGLAGDMPRYAATIERKVDTARSFAFGHLSSVMGELSRNLGRSTEETAAAASEPPAPSNEAPRPMPVEVRQPPPTPLAVAERLLTPVLHPLTTAGIVFVVAIFVLFQREDLRDRLIRLAGATDLHRTTTALNDAARRLSRYFLAQLGVNASFGCVISIGLFFIGVPSPLLWGVLGGLMRFVPYIGAPLAAVLPILLAAAVDPGWSMVLWTVALFLVTELSVSQAVEPLVYGHSTGLSPVSVLVAAIFWSWIWGPIGLLLSMPLTLCMVVLGRHVERLEFLDVMLGDRPALTPAESFYQRMLANDPDEALDQAELLLKEHSLCSYYDEVALKGLQLAAADAARGELPPERLERVSEAAHSVIADLDDHGDTDPTTEPGEEDVETPSLAEKSLPREPALRGNAPAPEVLAPEWRGARAVLCIAGRGPLDEAASAMLAQLLRNHGFGAEVLPHAAVARDRLARLDISGVAMVCLSYLEISGSPAHLRYLVRRLRQRLPKVPILVGLWPAEEAILSDLQLQAALRADHYVTTLHQAVAACTEIAHKTAGLERPQVSVA